MDNLGAWVGTVGGILGVAGVIAAGMVVVRSKIATATIALLNDNLTAQQQRIDILEAENSLLRDRVATLETTEASLFAQIKSLPAFEAMAVSLGEIHEAMTAQTDVISELIRTLVDA